MLGLLSKYFKQVSVLRRLLFAIIHLPEDIPNHWDLCVQFANNGLNTGLSADIAKMLSENIQALDAEAFTSDHTLHHELMQIPNKKPLGVVLISSRETCLRCHSKVSVRKDRPASITVYDDKIGTVPGTHTNIALTVDVAIPTTMDTTPQEVHVVLSHHLTLFMSQIGSHFLTSSLHVKQLSLSAC